MNDREKAQIELTHALRALHEETGEASRGPTGIARELMQRNTLAGLALCNAALAIERLDIISKEHGLPALEKLAPLLLDICYDCVDRVPDAAAACLADWRVRLVSRLLVEGRL